MARAKTSRSTSPSSATPLNNPVITMPDVSPTPQAKKNASVGNSTQPDLSAEIRKRAYELYEQRGSAPGYEYEDWLTAEREVLARRNRQQSA